MSIWFVLLIYNTFCEIFLFFFLFVVIDEVAGAEKVCREVKGACDVEERCNGQSIDCPEGKKKTFFYTFKIEIEKKIMIKDERAPSSVVCRKAQGVCDLPET